MRVRFLNRVLAQLASGSILRQFIIIPKRLLTKAFDAAYGISTIESRSWYGQFRDTSFFGDSQGTGQIDYLNLILLRRSLQLRSTDVFFDIGCGSGRLVCVMARKPLAKVVGIEYLEPLSRAAQRNAIKLRGRKSEIQIIRGDAAKADLTEGTVYCMFNPFGPSTMKAVLESIRQSLNLAPRSIKILYYHPVLSDILDRAEWLQRRESIVFLGEYSATIWQSSVTQFRNPEAQG